MKIVVEMSSEEFQEFMRWRSDKDCYENEQQQADAKHEHICNKILWALEKDEKRPGKVKVIDQEHATELVDMAMDWFC